MKNAEALLIDFRSAARCAAVRRERSTPTTTLSCIGLSIAVLCATVPGPRGARAQIPCTPDLALAVGIDALRWQEPSALAAEFAAYRRLGATWLRTDLNWSLVQPDGPDAHDWSTFDHLVELAADNGLTLLPVIGSTPAWARRDPERASPPRDAGEFARFAASAARRYGPSGIRVWEIWNEPNTAGSWPPEPDPAAYAALLQAASEAIRAVDPDATVVSGGLAAAAETGPPGAIRHHAAVEFAREMYANGAGGSFDAFGFHPYSFPLMPSDPAAWNGWTLMGGPVRDVLIANGDGDMPIWITEYGAPTVVDDPSLSEARQAEMLREAVRLAGEAPRPGPLFWYSYRDLTDLQAGVEAAFGLVRAPGRPKPAHEAFRELAERGTSSACRD